MEPSILMNLTRSRIVRLLLTCGPAAVVDISTALALRKSAVRRELDRLLLAGIVTEIEPADCRGLLAYSTDVMRIRQELVGLRCVLGLPVVDDPTRSPS